MSRRRGGPLLIAVLLVAIAAVCRFALFDLVEFKYDEARVSLLALNLAQHHVIPQTSILTSGGFQNPPLMVYLTAIPLLLASSPLAVTGFFTALNVLAVGGLYLVARRFAGELAAIIAAALYAVNPLAIHYSRKIWAPDAMPPFTLLLLAGLAFALGESEGWWLAPALVALGVLAQLHQAAIVFIPVTALLVLGFAHRLRWRQAATWGGGALGVVGFVLLLLPYAVYEWRHHWADLRGMAGQVNAHAALTAAPWRDLWWLAAGWNPQIFFANQVAQEHIRLVGSGPADWLALLLVLVGAGVCLVWLVRPEMGGATTAPMAKGGRRAIASTLLLLAVAPPLLIMRSAAPIFPHYLVFLEPLLFLFLGIGASATGQCFRRFRALPWAPVAVPAGLAAILVLVAFVRLADFDRMLTAHVTGGDYGTPLRYSLTAARALVGSSGIADRPRAFIMAADGDTIAVYRYLSAAGLAPAAAVVQPEQALPLSSAAVRYLFRTADDPAYRALQALPGAAVESIPPGSPAYRVVTAPRAPALGSAAQLVPGLRPAGPFVVGPGLTLTASDVSLAGASGPLTVTLAWSIADPTPFAAQPVRMFVHLYDGARHTVAQADTLGEPATAWRPGDQLLTWFTATPQAGRLAPGRYTLVAGVYVVAGFHVFPVTGPQGQSLGGEIPLGTVTVG